MKFNRDNKYLMIGLTAFAVIAAGLLFYTLLSRWSAVASVVSAFFGALAPVLVGVAIAYLLSPVVAFCEYFFNKANKKGYARTKKISRVLGVVIALLLVIAFTVGLILLVIPELVNSAEKLVANLEHYFGVTRDMINDFTNRDPELQSTADYLINQALVYSRNFLEKSVIDRADVIVQSLSTGIVSVVRAIVNFLIGVIVSAYLLYNKETFIRQVREFFKAFLPDKWFKTLISGTLNIHKLFGNFLLGKILASLIVGGVTAIFLAATGMPYAPLISVLVAVTNVIPFIGPFIGAVPSAFLLLLEDPWYCLVFVIFIIVIQQIDGNIISAKILGTSTGLSGFWVIFAIFVGGALFGFPGMVFGVPIFTVLYQAMDRVVQRRLERKQPDNPEPPPDDSPGGTS